MKFGETFKEYLHGDQERFLEKVSNVEYKRLKKVLRSCRSCKKLQTSSSADQEMCSEDCCNSINHQELCQCDSCPCKFEIAFNLEVSPRMIFCVKYYNANLGFCS